MQKWELKKLFKSSFGEKPKKRSLFKAIQLAIIMAIILAIIQITSLALLDHDFFGSVWSWTKDMFISLIDSEIEKDNIISESTKNNTYNTLEEFIEKEKIDIIVPKYMPNDLSIQKVTYNISRNNVIYIKYSDDVWLFVYLDKYLLPDDCDEVTDQYEINGNKYYFYKKIRQIDWIYNDNTYRLIVDFPNSEYENIIDSLY